jgi:hypothetical protein
VRIAADQQGRDVVAQVTGHGQLTAVDGTVAVAHDTVVGHDLQVTKLRPGFVTLTSAAPILV